MYRFQITPQRKSGKNCGFSVFIHSVDSAVFSGNLFPFRKYSPQTKGQSDPGTEPGYHLLLCNNRTVSGKSGSHQKDYGLIYDDSLFFVDYRTQGSNIYPEVTIIERGR